MEPAGLVIDRAGLQPGSVHPAARHRHRTQGPVHLQLRCHHGHLAHRHQPDGHFVHLLPALLRARTGPDRHQMSSDARVEQSVRYLSTLAFDDEFLDHVRAVSPRVVVQQITTDSAADIPDMLWTQIDVLHTSVVFPPPGIDCPARWIQLDTSGVDHLAGQPVWDSKAAITTLGGVGPVAMAEYVMFSVLGMA